MATSASGARGLDGRVLLCTRATLIGATLLARAGFAGARLVAAVRGCRRASSLTGSLPRAAARRKLRATEVFLPAGFVAAVRLPDFCAAAGDLELGSFRERASRVADFRLETDTGLMINAGCTDRFFAPRAAFSARLRARLAALTAARARFSSNLIFFRCRLATLTASPALATIRA